MQFVRGLTLKKLIGNYVKRNEGERNNYMIEHMNVINTLSDQISALLDLMQCADESADISSIRVASEMCLTMHDELMGEVDIMSREIKEQKK